MVSVWKSYEIATLLQQCDVCITYRKTSFPVTLTNRRPWVTQGPWVTLKVMHILQAFMMQFFVQSCSISQDFNWHRALRGLCVIDEPLLLLFERILYPIEYVCMINWVNCLLIFACAWIAWTRWNGEDCI